MWCRLLGALARRRRRPSQHSHRKNRKHRTATSGLEQTLEALLGDDLTGARPFEGLGTYDSVHHTFRQTAEAIGLEDYTMKDHRHTWAVQAFKDRLPIHAIYQQLGHADATMALKVYGRHTVRAEDYRVDQAPTVAFPVAVDA